MDKYFDFLAKKKFAPEILSLSGGKNSPKNYFAVLRGTSRLTQHYQNYFAFWHRAPKNGSNLMHDSLLEAYGQVLWHFDKKILPPIFALSGG